MLFRSPFPVGGKGGVGLLTRMGGQPLGDPAGCVHPPEVALGREDDGLPVDGRVTIIPGGRFRGDRAEGEENQCEGEEWSPHGEGEVRRRAT